MKSANHAAMPNAKRIMANTTWEDLRRRARQLENEVDNKLVNLNKLGVNIGGQTRLDINYDKTDNVPLLSSTQSTFDSLSGEIKHLIEQLTAINDDMSSLMNQNPSMASTAALSHTLQRHRDILRDYSNEYSKTHSQIQQRLQREELLQAVARENDRFRSGLNNRRNDGYLKEHDHIKSSDRLLDDHISVAINVRDSVSNQGTAFREITRKLHTLTKKYPALHGLMQRINMKRRRDSIVVAIVISICLFLTFIYAIS